MWTRIVVFAFLFNKVIGNANPRIVIVGAGASGIAASTKLYENGFENIVILEAEDRIGGRVYTVEFEDYVVDLGAEWVHGQKGNVAYELASPLGLLEESNMTSKYYDAYRSSGIPVDSSVVEDIWSFYWNITENSTDMQLKNYATVGEYFDEKFKEYFNEHPEINAALQREFLQLFNLTQAAGDAADSWYNVTMDSNYVMCEGDYLNNWKDRGYSTILDILLKKLPNPEMELPIKDKVVLNAEVTKIDYNDEEIKITTADGTMYLADHVITTTSLGVLKADHQNLFEPPLPNDKINDIEGIGFGTVCKIFLAFPEPWWENTDDKPGFLLLWTDEDRAKLQDDPERRWLLYNIVLSRVAHKPRLLSSWVIGEGARLIENFPDSFVLDEVTNITRKFLSQNYNITEPTAIKRNRWYSNKHFRGTYSYSNLETKKRGASRERLSQPITRAEKPMILFAGEATHKSFYSTVHGAIESGWREAQRIIKFYADKAS